MENNILKAFYDLNKQIKKQRVGKDINTLYGNITYEGGQALLEHFKEYNSSVLFSFFENKMKEDLNTINNQLSYISNKASTYIYFYLAKFYIDIEYAKSLNYSKRIYDEKVAA